MPIVTNKCESERINRHRARVIFSNYVIEQVGVTAKLQLSAEIISGSGSALEESAYTPIVEGANFTTAAELSTIVASASTTFGITTATVPGAPTGVSGVSGNAQVTVSWTPPSSNGGSAITSYRVTSSPGGITATTSGTSVVVTGLTNNTAYTFTVTATNSVGTSVASAASPSVTPVIPNGSLSFNGTTSSASWTGFSAGSGGFTVECFVYVTDFSTKNAILSGFYSVANTTLGISITSSTNIAIERINSGTTLNFTVPTMSTNTWYHLVYVRNSSNQATVFLAGTRSSTSFVTDSVSYSPSSGLIGCARVNIDPQILSAVLKGNINNLRVVTSTAVYDPTAATITVPTSNLTVVGGNNTILLMNTLNDASVYLKDSSNFNSTVSASNVTSSSLAPF